MRMVAAAGDVAARASEAFSTDRSLAQIRSDQAGRLGELLAFVRVFAAEAGGSLGSVLKADADRRSAVAGQELVGRG